jgi:hypothetical protein
MRNTNSTEELTAGVRKSLRTPTRAFWFTISHCNNKKIANVSDNKKTCAYLVWRENSNENACSARDLSNFPGRASLALGAPLIQDGVKSSWSNERLNQRFSSLSSCR